MVCGLEPSGYKLPQQRPVFLHNQATVDLILRMLLHIQCLHQQVKYDTNPSAQQSRIPQPCQSSMPCLCFSAEIGMIQTIFTSLNKVLRHVKMRSQLHSSTSTARSSVLSPAFNSLSNSTEELPHLPHLPPRICQYDTNDDGLLRAKKSMLVPRAI